MNTLLTVTYSIVFAAMVAYVLHLRRRIAAVEGRLEDVRARRREHAEE